MPVLMQTLMHACAKVCTWTMYVYTKVYINSPSTNHNPVTSFIHTFRPFLERPFKSSTTQRRSRLQHGYCIGVSRRSAQATAGKGLPQGPYVTARARIEPTTFRLKVIASTNALPRPTLRRCRPGEGGGYSKRSRHGRITTLRESGQLYNIMEINYNKYKSSIFFIHFFP